MKTYYFMHWQSCNTNRETWVPVDCGISLVWLWVQLRVLQVQGSMYEN